MGTGWRRKRFLVCLFVIFLSHGFWEDHFSNTCQAVEGPASGPVKVMRAKVEACWDAVLMGDAETARKRAQEIQDTWNKLPPLVRRVITTRHPQIESAIANLPEEAAQFAIERANWLAQQKQIAPTVEGTAVQPVAAVAPPPPTPSSPKSAPSTGVILLGASALPTKETLAPDVAPKMEQLTILHLPDKKVVVFDAKSNAKRTVVVEGNERTTTVTATFTDPSQLVVVNPYRWSVSVQHPGGVLTLAPYSYTSISISNGDVSLLKVIEPASTRILVLKAGLPARYVTAQDTVQTLFVVRNEPVTIVMTDPEQQKVIAMTPTSPARVIVLYPAYQMAYAVAAVPTSYQEVVYVGAAYTPTVTYVTASGTPAVVSVPAATSAAYVINSPQAVVYQDPSGTVAITGPYGTTTVSHAGGGAAVTVGATTYMGHAGQTTVTGPGGNSATVTGASGHSVTTAGNTTSGSAAGAANIQTSTGQNLTAAGAATGSVTTSGDTVSRQSSMGGTVYNNNTGQWVAGERSGASQVTKNESGQVTGAQYQGQSAVTTSTGVTATAQTQASAQNLGTGQGSVEAHADVQTNTGKDYSVDATAGKGEATVTATNNVTGQTKTATVGDQQLQNAPQSAKTAPKTTSSTQSSTAAKAAPTTPGQTATSATAQKPATSTGLAQRAAPPSPPASGGQASIQPPGPTAARQPAAPSGAQRMAPPSSQSTDASRWTSNSRGSYKDEYDIFGDTGFGKGRSQGGVAPAPATPSPGTARQGTHGGGGGGRGGALRR